LLSDQVDEKTACICYFGGDPSPQLPYSLRASRLALDRNPGQILRIYWETNDTMHPSRLRHATELSLRSGGCIKFDLKAWSEEVNIALCGVTNKRTVRNVELLALYSKGRPAPSFSPGTSIMRKWLRLRPLSPPLTQRSRTAFLPSIPNSSWATCLPPRGISP